MGGPLELDSVVVQDATGLDVVARLAGMSLADVRELNPSYLREITPPKRKSVLRLPAGAGEPTRSGLEALPASERLGTFPHRARSGETLTSLGKKYGVGLAAMREANADLASRAPRRGEVVRIPGEARLKGWIAENKRASSSDVLSGGTSHRVRRGETLGAIARRYRVTVAQLRAWNGLRSTAIRQGQVLRLRPGRVRTPTATSQAGSARVHLVRAGDTLSSIARRYGTTISALRSANSLSSGRTLLAGQRLRIPS
jgi:membrane-bound lytic murein transglycosylase D